MTIYKLVGIKGNQQNALYDAHVRLDTTDADDHYVTFVQDTSFRMSGGEIEIIDPTTLEETIITPDYIVSPLTKINRVIDEYEIIDIDIDRELPYQH